jgi:hypothetical protein
MLRSKLNNSAVAIIDWNISGHHPTYLREYTIAFSEQNIPVVVLSPEPPDIAPLPSSVAWKKIPTTTWMKRRQLFGMPIARWLFARRLLKVLRQLVDAGNTMVVIEHNLDVIKTADWVIDMGPLGGSGGGQVVATGTPEQIALNPQSVTGRYIQRLLPAG